MKKKYLKFTGSLAVFLLAGGLTLSSAAAEDKISKAKDGYTVEELYVKKDSLNGKKVSVHGKVVKFNGGIMGKNWLHVQDGSGKQGTNDMTVTTNQTVKVGDVVLVSGVMATDKDFGGGYKYKAILEESTVSVDK